MKFPAAYRVAWNCMPDVIIAADEKAVKSAVDYAAAKAGDIGAATRLVSGFTDDALLTKVKILIGNTNPVVVPVHAVEDTGINQIPAAFAAILAGRLGLNVTNDIVQSNRVGHTGAGGWHRLSLQPCLTARRRLAGRTCLSTTSLVKVAR